MNVRIMNGGEPMRITAKGQVTIPAEIREKMGLLPNTEVEFKIDGETVRLIKVKTQNQRGSELIARMRGKATTGMSTEQIMALTREE